MNYTIKPEEHELREARSAIEAAIESAKHVLEKEDDLEFYIAWDGRPSMIKEQGGAAGRTVSSEIVTVSFNTSADGWKDNLKSVAAHEYGHAYFVEKNSGLSDFLWQWVLEEALAQNFAEEIFPENPRPQRDAVDRDELEQKWPEIRQIMGEEMDYNHDLFFGGENFERWTGYSLSYLIGQKLLEVHDLEELTELKRSDIIEAGDQLFG